MVDRLTSPQNQIKDEFNNILEQDPFILWCLIAIDNIWFFPTMLVSFWMEITMAVIYSLPIYKTFTAINDQQADLGKEYFDNRWSRRLRILLLPYTVNKWIFDFIGVPIALSWIDVTVSILDFLRSIFE